VLHTALIALHAAAGIVAVAAGGAALRQRPGFSVYLWSLVACIGLLAFAIAVEWSSLDTTSRVLFAAFTALGAVMVARAIAAHRLLTAGRARSPRYLDHIGFTLVALLDAFLVILVLDLGAPGWLVTGAGVIGAIAGHHALAILKHRLADQEARLADPRHRHRSASR